MPRFILPALLVIAAVAAVLILSFSDVGGPSAPDLPETDPEADRIPAPLPDIDTTPALPILDLPPESAPTGKQPAPAPKKGATPAQALAGAAMHRAGRVLREYVEVSAYLAGGPIPDQKFDVPREMVTALLTAVAAANPGERLQAVLALSVVNLAPEEIDLLARRIESELSAMKTPAEKNVVLALAYSLAAHGDRRGVERLADALRTGEGAEVGDFRNGAALVLGLTEDEGSSEVLRDLLVADPDRVVRKHAATSLGRIGGEDNRSALSDSLLREEDIEVRAWAALAAGRAAPDGGGAPDLLTVLSEDPAGEVRGAAAYALSKAGGEDTFQTLRDAYYADDHPFTRIGSVAGIAARGEADEATREFLEGEGSAFLVATATGAPDTAARYYSSYSLSLLPTSEERGAALRKVAAEDSSGWVRSGAVASLVATEGKAAVPFLETIAAAEKSKHVKRQIEAAIARLE